MDLLLEGKDVNVKNKLSVDNKKILSVNDFRLRGNDYFMLNNFAAAIDEYSRGIKLEPHHVPLLSNRAEAYLRLNQFGKALSDVEIVLKYENDHLKATFRKGKALCGLQRYQEAITIFQILLQRMQTSIDRKNILIIKNTKKLLKHATTLNSENINGQYDYLYIVDEFCEKVKIKKSHQGNDIWVCETGPRLDHADFLTEDIEIRPVEGKGRGWVAKQNIPEHTLLMVSKAFRVVYSNETPLSINQELITGIAQKLKKDPDLCREVYQLYGGSDLIPMEKLDDNLLYSVDIKRIERVVQYNSFQMECLHVFENIGESSRLSKEVGSGLWILPSYFNHSCVDTNIDRFIIGDLMFIRSCRPILKDEELIFSYSDPTCSYEKRSKHLKTYEINCQCRLCKLDQSEEHNTRTLRANILETYEKFAATLTKNPHFDPILISELINIITKLHDLRKEHLELEFQSLKPKSALALAYIKSGDLCQSLSILQETYNFLKTTIQRISLVSDVTFQISFCYFKFGQTKEAKKWFDVALKELVEPLRGKFKNDEIRWREEALHLAEKLSSNEISIAKKIGLI